jgi:hypothetical protein
VNKAVGKPQLSMQAGQAQGIGQVTTAQNAPKNYSSKYLMYSKRRTTMSDEEFVLVFIIGWLCHLAFAKMMAWVEEQDRLDKERIYDWDRDDDEFGW